MNIHSEKKVIFKQYLYICPQLKLGVTHKTSTSHGYEEE